MIILLNYLQSMLDMFPPTVCKSVEVSSIRLRRVSDICGEHKLYHKDVFHQL